MPGTRRAALTLFAVLLALLPPSHPAAAQGSRWHPGEGFPSYCTDATRADTTLLSVSASSESPLPPGSYAFSWATGETTRLAEVPFETCNPANGLLYGQLHRSEAAGLSEVVLFSSSSPQPTVIDRMPTHFALDGSLWVYALKTWPTDSPVELWASADGGRSWQRRALPTEEYLLDLTVAPADGRAIYLLVSTPPSAEQPEAPRYTIFFSPDAGATWELRSSGAISPGPTSDTVYMGTFSSAATPVGTVYISALYGLGRYAAFTDYLSTDGGRTFSLTIPGNNDGDDLSYGPTTQVYRTRDGLLRLTASSYDGDGTLERSVDGGASWEQLSLPFRIYHDFYRNIDTRQAFAAPDVIALRDSEMVWQLTTDGGRSWQPMEGVSHLVGFTYALPVRALTIVDGQHLVRELPGAERSVIGPATPKGLPDGAFFPETGHNLGGPFRAYWERSGGLAAFGYPISEPFRERNPADGRVYLVQYFERNRFEHHPELAGTPDEVQLGLLGSQLTEARRAAGEAPFRPVAGPAGAGDRFFPATGHTLSGAFRAYWERSGGLAAFGYPISEPFRERNPADGRVYLVQYFERNRFEHHPELAGTPSEVLLGLLGEQALRERGWD